MMSRLKTFVGFLILSSSFISLYLSLSTTYNRGRFQKQLASEEQVDIEPFFNYPKDAEIFSVEDLPPTEFLPWFMEGGKLRPDSSNVSISCDALMSNKKNGGDRIIEQLMYFPSDKNLTKLKNKKIFSLSKNVKDKSNLYHCPINACSITSNEAQIATVDAVILGRDDRWFPVKNPMISILYTLESPEFTRYIKPYNWTATYRHDSDIVAPYYRWEYYDKNIRQINHSTNYALGKTKQVAWFVSNCKAKNNRKEYAIELSKYINVDFFGICGPVEKRKKCHRKFNNQRCFKMLREDYKFYLSFENSNCRDYITEKFYQNALSNDVIPIVMGAHPDDYKRVAPEFSYIHVDDFHSPKQLAEYLHFLDSNDDLYNHYFRWKGTGEFINTHFLCRICALLHSECQKPKYYEDMRGWWKGTVEKMCTKGSWRNATKKVGNQL